MIPSLVSQQVKIARSRSLSQYEQDKLADLIKRISADPGVFSNGATKFRNLLSDFLPSRRIERFWICSVFEMPSFVNALAQGKIHSADISRLEFFLHHRLELTQNIARWISEIWAIAFGIKSPQEKKSFSCPHCSLTGSCDERWRDRITSCPSCNALIRFNSSLEIYLEKLGWSKKRLKNRNWLLQDPRFASQESSLRTAIAQTIDNDQLTSSEIAKHIGLDLIVSSLQSEINALLGDIQNQTVAAMENIVKAVLRSSLREEYACFNLHEDFPPPASFCSIGDCSPGERWVAVVGSLSSTPFHGLAFSDTALHYAKDGDRWSLSYLDLHQLPITLGESITQLRIGEHRVIDLKGLGVPRRAIQPTLSLIGKCIYEVLEKARQ